MKNLKGIKILNENEMKMVTGGNTSLPINERYLSKNVCLEEAKWLGHYGAVTGMSVQQIAEEIYAHAVIYYKSLPVGTIAAAVSRTGVSGLAGIATLVTLISAILINKGKEVDITNGGDTKARQLLYKGVWIAY
ncbi:MAG: hypothetical protein RSD22_06470 [Romboutsia sp.]